MPVHARIAGIILLTAFAAVAAGGCRDRPAAGGGTAGSQGAGGMVVLGLPAPSYETLVAGRRLRYRDQLGEATQEAIRTPGVTAEERVQLGAACLRLGDLRGAAVRCSEAIRGDAESWRAYPLLGEALRRLGLERQAEAAVRREIGRGPERAGGYLDLARLLYRERRGGEAAAALAEAARRAGQDPATHVDVAAAAADLGNPRMAEAECAAASGLKSDFAPAFALLGAVQLGRNQPEAAAASLRRAVELEPRDGRAHRLLASALQALPTADPHAAESHLRRAVETDPADTAARYDLAVLHRRLGNAAAAASELNAVLEAQPDHEGARYALGQIAAAAEKPEVASDHLRLLRRLQEERRAWQALADRAGPGDPAAVLALARFDRDRGALADALAGYQAADQQRAPGAAVDLAGFYAALQWPSLWLPERPAAVVSAG